MKTPNLFSNDPAIAKRANDEYEARVMNRKIAPLEANPAIEEIQPSKLGGKVDGFMVYLACGFFTFSGETEFWAPDLETIARRIEAGFDETGEVGTTSQ